MKQGSENKINIQRKFWLDKIDTQIHELKFLSLEGHRNMYESMWDDLETSFIALWRFDNRLRQHRTEKAKQESNEDIS